MERPAILLDENLLWCHHSPEHYELFGQMVVERLRELNVTGDVFFVGQKEIFRWDPEKKEWKPLPIEKELQAEDVKRRTWYVEIGEYHNIFRQAAWDCEAEITKLNPRYGKGWHLRPEYRREARRVYIKCLRERMAAAPADSPRNWSGRIPRRGVRDYDIKAWALDNNVLIVSGDYGADLQPGKVTERILLRRPECDGNMTNNAERLALAIVERLREVKNLLGGVP